jgi:hypothetical protein
MTWQEEAEAALADFREVARLGGIELDTGWASVEWLQMPHRAPPHMPAGKMAVYAFWGDGAWLKVGKAGPNSQPRYTSQHYNAGSAKSTLAASLISSPPSGPKLDPQTCGEWIRANTHRFNILVPSDRPRELLSLLEAFLHLRLRPRFEG